jgi:hypothetical protein
MSWGIENLSPTEINVPGYSIYDQEWKWRLAINKVSFSEITTDSELLETGSG